MAMPTSARASAGASFMPSPTKATAPALRPPDACLARSAIIVSSASTFCPGSRSARYSSMPTSVATCWATRLTSPVSMTRRFTPAALSLRTACSAPGLTTSATRMRPASTPSLATFTTVPSVTHTSCGTFSRCKSRSLPARTDWPATTARTPIPLTSSLAVMDDSSIALLSSPPFW